MFIATGPYFHSFKPRRGGTKPHRWRYVAPLGLRNIFLNDAINMALLWSLPLAQRPNHEILGTLGVPSAYRCRHCLMPLSLTGTTASWHPQSGQDVGAPQYASCTHRTRCFRFYLVCRLLNCY